MSVNVCLDCFCSLANTDTICLAIISANGNCLQLQTSASPRGARVYYPASAIFVVNILRLGHLKCFCFPLYFFPDILYTFFLFSFYWLYLNSGFVFADSFVVPRNRFLGHLQHCDVCVYTMFLTYNFWDFWPREYLLHVTFIKRRPFKYPSNINITIENNGRIVPDSKFTLYNTLYTVYTIGNYF